MARSSNTDADELLLFIDNDFPLYQQKQAIQTNLAKHVCRGNFRKADAERAFQHLTDPAGKKYMKEFGGPGDRFPVAARREAAKELVKEFVAKVRLYRDKGVRDLPEGAMKLLSSGACKPGGELACTLGRATAKASRRRRRRRR